QPSGLAGGVADGFRLHTALDQLDGAADYPISIDGEPLRSLGLGRRDSGLNLRFSQVFVADLRRRPMRVSRPDRRLRGAEVNKVLLGEVLLLLRHGVHVASLYPVQPLSDRP